MLNEKKNELVKQGRTIYNLSVGTPDFPPMPHIMEAVSEAAKRPENYKYALSELPELLDAVQSFYQKRFGVQLEADEIMTMYGSQEGMAHIAWALCNPGELVLVPNPGYQIFSAGPRLCDAEVWEYPLLEEQQFLPQLDEIPEEIARRARYMVVSYPANPICRTAPESFYRDLIAFAKNTRSSSCTITLIQTLFMMEGGAAPFWSTREQRRSELNFIPFPNPSITPAHACPLQ